MATCVVQQFGRRPHRVGGEGAVSLNRSRRTLRWFVGGAAQRKATVICRHCPVIAECLADALHNQMEFSVWGGMTERQRHALLKQHPEVDSWAKLFAAQRKHRNADGQRAMR
jgi:WhiB family transcriptional regulator, redox-sensing transcriptional regulator